MIKPAIHLSVIGPFTSWIITDCHPQHTEHTLVVETNQGTGLMMYMHNCVQTSHNLFSIVSFN